MKRKNTATKSLATILTAALVFGTCAAPVFAANDETETVIVYASPESGNQSVEVGNVTTTEGPGAAVTADGGATAELTTGNISSPDDGVIAQALDSTADVTVNGTITSTDSDGIAATAYGETGSVKVHAEGDVSGKVAGIFTEAYDGGTTTVTANGNVKGNDCGIIVANEDEDTDNFSKVDITVKGNVTGVYDEGVYVDSGVEGGDVSIKVGGDVVSEYDSAVAVESYYGTKTKLDIAGNVVGQAYGLYLDGDEGGVLDVTVGGNA